jgi:hypothetical protein
MRIQVIDTPNRKPEDGLRFVWIDPFEGQWRQLGLPEEACRGIELAIMAAPRKAPVISGTGGLRKLRFAVEGSQRGKSGSYRVFYSYFEDFGTVVLVAIIDKTRDANLSRAQRQGLAHVLAEIQDALEKGA